MPGYSMSADEVTYWQDLAALLDPDAYELVVGANVSRTVTTGETWYLLWGWFLQATGGGEHFFQRHANVYEALPLTAGRVLTTHATNAGSTMYLCKPSLVVSGDSRYTDDPRALFFDRLRRVGELTHYQVGGTSTNNANVAVAFPTDFTPGLVIHQSVHDVAWLGLKNVAGTTVVATQDEISDTDRARFANTTFLPFLRTTFDRIELRGASQSEGRATMTYVKLPGDW